MLTFVFGSPGSGKTCYLARLAKKESKKRKVYCNEDIHGTTYFPTGTGGSLGYLTPPEGSLILLDECGIDYNNRKYKSLSDEVIYYLKKHRHYKVDIVVVSQSWDDIDITFRRLAERYYLLRRLPFFTLATRCVRRIKLKTDDGLPADVIEPVGFFSGLFTMLFGGLAPLFLFNRASLYWRFDSYERKDLPVIPADSRKMTKPKWYRFKLWAKALKRNWIPIALIAAVLFLLTLIF